MMTLPRFYALFKQVTTGHADRKRSGITDMIGRMKYDAWDVLKGTSKENAIPQQYVDLITGLKG